MATADEFKACDIERVALVIEPGSTPTAGPYGAVISAVGRIYVPLHQYYHGVICALLYPELAAAYRTTSFGEELEIPEDSFADFHVMRYQSFELDNAPNMEVIRVSHSWVAGMYISKGRAPATEAQITAFVAYMKAAGYSGRAKITTSEGEKTVAQIVEGLRQDENFTEEP